MAVYLDYNATTPVDKTVFEAMSPFFCSDFGNPSSQHRFGRAARHALEQAREQVAELVAVHPSQVIFTSGGTEANNLALKGVGQIPEINRLLVGATEHSSVIKTAQALSEKGWQVDTVDVDGNGLVDPDHFLACLDASPSAVSLMLANNETGVIQSIPALAAMVRDGGGIMHTDAVQAAGKIGIDFTETGVHLMTLSAHKIYGPKGVGALIVDKALKLSPLIHGGGQEKGYRGGTENVPAIVGFGAAAMLAKQKLASESIRLQGLRDRLQSGLRALGKIQIFGENAPRLTNTVFFSVPGIDGAALLLALDKAGFAVSSGSACSSERLAPSHVLLAMGAEEEIARGAIRVSLGHGNDTHDIDEFVEALGREVQNMRRLINRAAS